MRRCDKTRRVNVGSYRPTFRITLLPVVWALALLGVAQTPQYESPEARSVVDRLATHPAKAEGELMRSLGADVCAALARALREDDRFHESFRRSVAYRLLAQPDCSASVDIVELLVTDVASDKEGIAEAAYTQMLGTAPEKLIRPLANAFILDARFADQRVRRRVSTLFVHISAAKFPQATDALVVGVRDGNGDVQSSCALALSKGTAEPQRRALEALAPIWRNHRELPAFRSVRALRCAMLFGSPLDDYTDEFEGLLLDQSVDIQVRAASGGAMLHAGRIRRGLDLLEQLDRPGKVAMMKELKNVYAQRHDFLKREPDQALRLRSIILGALRSEDIELRRAAFGSLVVGFHDELLLKDDGGQWILNPQVRAILEQIVANDPDEELVGQTRKMLDPSQTLGHLIKGAEVREQNEKRLHKKDQQP